MFDEDFSICEFIKDKSDCSLYEIVEGVSDMKSMNTLHLVGGMFTVAIAFTLASVGQHAWADDMTQPVAVTPASGQVTDEVQLQAIFMDIQGKVRWRMAGVSGWTEAKVNDLLSPGAEIRTGLKSRAGLRIGKNATILVDAGTTFQLPNMVQDGQTLRTLASVKSGRVDFKVDHVGFTNDFQVVTPQTTLAVRGTGLYVDYSPSKGVEIGGADSNTMRAVEVKYITLNRIYFLSGQGQTATEQDKQDPVRNAWVNTIGPPPILGTLVSQSDLDQLLEQGFAGVDPSTNFQQIQQTQAAESSDTAIDTALLLAYESDGLDPSARYEPFVDYAKPFVDEAGTQSGFVQDFALGFDVQGTRGGGAMQAAREAEEQLAQDGANVASINDQLNIMMTQVNVMQSNNGVADMKGNFQVGTLQHYQSQSVIDLTSSNQYKDSFDNLFQQGAPRTELIFDLTSLKQLNDLYDPGISTSHLQIAMALHGEITNAHALVNNANVSIEDTTSVFVSKLEQAQLLTREAQGVFDQNLSNSKSTANQYLQDFQSIVGQNNSEAVQSALAAVTQLIGEHNAYIDQAQNAITAAEKASKNAQTRGEKVYMNVLARELDRAAKIQIQADAAQLELVVNGSLIQGNYSQAKNNYETP